MISLTETNAKPPSLQTASNSIHTGEKCRTPTNPAGCFDLAHGPPHIIPYSFAKLRSRRFRTHRRIFSSEALRTSLPLRTQCLLCHETDILPITPEFVYLPLLITCQRAPKIYFSRLKPISGGWEPKFGGPPTGQGLRLSSGSTSQLDWPMLNCTCLN